MPEKSSVLKWLAGILATVIGALIIWFLTSEGGLLNPPEEPDLKFLEVEHTNNISPGQSFDLTVRVINESETAAESCTINLYAGRQSFGVNQTPDTPIRQDIRGIGGFAPGETKTVTVTGFDPPFTEPGLHWATFAIVCRPASPVWDYISLRVTEN